MKKGQIIYVTVYCTGCYSDYLEQVVGITDSKEQALGFAKQMADYVNSQKHWWLDEDSIVIRKYKWDEFLVNTSKAQRSLYQFEGPNEIEVYKSGNYMHGKLKQVEED